MKIAIVGLGTAGACMLDSLEQALGDRQDVRLTLYDPTGERWVGRAFQDDSDCILANSPVPTMSLRHGDDDHARRWLVAQGRLDPDDSALTFFPRALYGRYISDHATELVTDLRRRGWDVEFVKESVTSLQWSMTAGYTVGTARRSDRHDYVVLCAGGSALGNPFDLDPGPGYVADPYPTRERLRDIPTGAAIGILGSGLSAVDVAVALQAQGHAGPVTLYSRSGVLQYVRRPGPDWTPEHLTIDRVLDLSRSNGGLRLADLHLLFDLEVRAAGGESRGMFPVPTVSEPRAWLRWQLEHPIGQTDLGTLIFQRSVPTALWGHVWYLLNREDKRRLMASSLRDIMARCSPMPPVNAQKVLAMLDSGQLQIRPGVQSVLPARGGFDVQLASGTEHVDHVVNAMTPVSYGVHPGSQQLVDSAVGNGLARLHAWGGVQVERTSGAVHGGRGRAGVYALGNLTRGAYFFIFSLPTLVDRSVDIATSIRRDSESRPVPMTSMTHARRGVPAAAWSGEEAV